MSLRRKSCDGCFRARRKCDLSYPTCRDCERRGKHCEYAYPPQLEVNPVDQLQDGDPQKTASLETTAPSSRRSFRVAKQWREPAVKYTRPERLQLSLGTPKFPEPQGHLQPPVGYDAALPRRPGRFAWVYDQIRDTPYMFAMQAESHFIHRSLIEQYFPRTLRAAFGICAATTTMTDMNKDFLFKAIDAEVTDLLAVRQDTTLLDGLATLQAAVLYQIIRLFRGGWQQRYIAEQQEYLVRSYALTLLRRSSSSSSFSSSPSSSRNFDTWLLEESIRRTVMFAFKIYTMYWSLRRQVCFEIEGLNLLPVSTSPELWEKEGRELFGGHEDPDAVMTHEEFTKMMGAKKSLEGEAPFQKLLVLGCREKLDGAVLESLG